MAKRGALDLELDAIKARLSVAESYISAVEGCVHFTVPEVQALVARIDALEAAATAPKPATKAKDSK